MRIPPYWNRASYSGTDRNGTMHTAWAWGWSFESMEAAAQDAQARALRVFEALSRGERPDSYEYTQHPLREEIVESFGDGERPTAVLTRNRYGALVLNTPSVCFVDVDYPPVRSKGAWDGLMMSFSAQRREKRKIEQQAETLERVRRWARRSGSCRIYQTAAGLRVLLTDRLYDPMSSQVAEIFQEMGADLLYRQLTLKQNCFRARLTPKPWRCGLTQPPGVFPFTTPEAVHQQKEWLRTYEARSVSFATCRLLETVGYPGASEPFATVVALHDQYACGQAAAPLA